MESYQISTKLVCPSYPDYSVFVNGNVSGSDIKWNAFKGSFALHEKDYFFAEGIINAFTRNCGAKTLEHLSIRINNPIWYRILESFMFHKLNCSLIVGSDSSSGHTWSRLRELGFTPTPEVHNPNYRFLPKGEVHSILAFWKIVNGTDYKDDKWPVTGLYNDH